MRTAIALLFLLFAASAQAADRGLEAMRAGEDIAEYRRITHDGLPPAERLDAMREFVRSYPESPLAELALGECVQHGQEARDVLAGLPPNERTQLLARYRSHQKQVTVDGPATAEEEEPTLRTRVQTRRNMRKSSR